MVLLWPRRHEWHQTSAYTRVTWKVPESADYRPWPAPESSVAGVEEAIAQPIPRQLLVRPTLREMLPETKVGRGD